MKHKLSCIRRPWRRLVLSLSVSLFTLFNRYARSRARIHWVGRHDRPRRPQRALFAITFLSSFVFIRRWDFMFWSVMWGGALSLFVSLLALYQLRPRKRAHWIQ